MDPTLANGEVLFVVKHLPINRFDIVVAHEDDGNKDIVKRVIGMPGDTIRYENDKLYINGQETDEPYLAEYLKRFKEDKKTVAHPFKTRTIGECVYKATTRF